jgi:glycosyltransferase involved in cell wall biosynthesis
MRSWRQTILGRPTVSVAMATYNGERYLPEMLDSIAAQTLQPDELVVRDDGSEDGTVGILHAFARRMPFRVEVISGGPRLGYAQNFVAASRACAGQLIFFADQDDSWRPPKLATVAHRVRRREPVAVFHDFSLQSGDGTRLTPSVYALLAERGFGPAAAVNGCTMAVTRRFVDTWGWPPEESHVHHDVWVAILSTAFGQRRYVASSLIDYRLHDDNASGWLPHPDARVFTEPHTEGSDVDLLVDLLIKRRVRARTRAFMQVLRDRGDAVDAEASRRLARTLRKNRRRHLRVKN